MAKITLLQTLSRAPVNVISAYLAFQVDDWLAAQKRDRFCSELINSLLTSGDDGVQPSIPNAERTLTSLDSFQLLEGGLLANAQGKVVVPASKREHLLYTYHDHKLGGHLGITRTFNNLNTRWFWPSHRRDVASYVKSCAACARRKIARLPKAEMMPLPVEDWALSRLKIDSVGPVPTSTRGNCQILTAIDSCTRYGWAMACTNIQASTVIRKLIKHIINHEGCPRVIQSENGASFTGSLFQEFCSQMIIIHVTSTSFSPQSNGIIEIMHKPLNNHLSIYAKNNPNNLVEYLGSFMLHQNTTPHPALGDDTPFHQMKGRDELHPTDIRPPMRYRLTNDPNDWYRDKWHEAREIALAHQVISKETQKKYYDRGTKTRSFEIGDRVLLKIMHQQTGKFYDKFTPTHIVVDRLNDVNYIVRKDTSNACTTVHVNRMRPAETSRIPIGPDDISADSVDGATTADNMNAREPMNSPVFDEETETFTVGPTKMVES